MKDDTIMYKRIDDNSWHEIFVSGKPYDFTPRDDDFKFIEFKIGKKIYSEPSDEFYKKFDAIKMRMVMTS